MSNPIKNVWFCFILNAGSFASENHRRLRHDLFFNNSVYDPSIRPVRNDSTATVVEMQFFVAQVLDVVGGQQRALLISMVHTEAIFESPG